MSNTVIANKDYRFHYNSDGSDLQLSKYDFSVNIPIEFDSVKKMVAEIVRAKKISELEQMTSDQILGL